MKIRRVYMIIRSKNLCKSECIGNAKAPYLPDFGGSDTDR